MLTPCLLQLAELKKKLDEVQSTASADHLAKVDLESLQHRLHGDTSRLERRLAAVEADRESLNQQLKANVHICLRYSIKRTWHVSIVIIPLTIDCRHVGCTLGHAFALCAGRLL